MTDLLSAAEVSAALDELDGWSGDTSVIARSVSFPTFLTGISVVDQVAGVAEQMDHHPDIDIRWRTVTFNCATHSAGGVTVKDLDLARRINEIVTVASAAA